MKGCMHVNNDPVITWHAWARMAERDISEEQVRLALRFGRKYRQDGADVFAIWRDEAELMRRRGVNVGGCNGVHVVCGRNGEIVTVYRRQDLFSDSWH